MFVVNCIEKNKINKKKPGMAHLKTDFQSIFISWHFETIQSKVNKSFWQSFFKKYISKSFCIILTFRKIFGREIFKNPEKQELLPTTNSKWLSRIWLSFRWKKHIFTYGPYVVYLLFQYYKYTLATNDCFTPFNKKLVRFVKKCLNLI